MAGVSNELSLMTCGILCVCRACTVCGRRGVFPHAVRSGLLEMQQLELTCSAFKQPGHFAHKVNQLHLGNTLHYC